MSLVSTTTTAQPPAAAPAPRHLRSAIISGLAGVSCILLGIVSSSNLTDRELASSQQADQSTAIIITSQTADHSLTALETAWKTRPADEPLVSNDFRNNLAQYIRAVQTLAARTSGQTDTQKTVGATVRLASQLDHEATTGKYTVASTEGFQNARAALHKLITDHGTLASSLKEKVRSHRSRRVALVLGTSLAGICLIGLAGCFIYLERRSFLNKNTSTHTVASVSANPFSNTPKLVIPRDHFPARESLDALPNPMIGFDSVGRILAMNNAAEKMFNQRIQDLNGRTLTLLFPKPQILFDAVRTGSGKTEVEAACPGGTRPVQLAIIEIERGGQTRYYAECVTSPEAKSDTDIVRDMALSLSTRTGTDFLNGLVEQITSSLNVGHAFIIELPNSVRATPVLTLAERGTLHSTGQYFIKNTAAAEILRVGQGRWTGGVRERFPSDRMLAVLEAEAIAGIVLRNAQGHEIGVLGVFDPQVLPNEKLLNAAFLSFAGRAAAELERQRFEAELGSEKETLSVILRSVTDGFIALDADGNVVVLNAAAENLTAWSTADAASRPVSEILALRDRTDTVNTAAIYEAIHAGRNPEVADTLALRGHYGGERLVELSVSPIGNRDGTSAGMVIIFRDITDRQRQQEQRAKAEKLESLGIAAGGIAHDFNNLITGILGHVSLVMEHGDVDADVFGRLTQVKKAASRSKELAQQLLTFAKGGAPVKQNASIAQILRDTASFSLRGKQVLAEFNITDDLWQANVDAGQISQVIANLVINAEQAMPNGGNICVSARNVRIPDDVHRDGLAPGRYIEMRVSDNGSGIPQDILPKIFDPYFTTKSKGSGLGLATSYSIIKNHQGHIEVESQPAQGTTFTIYLPASSDAAKPAPAREETLRVFAENTSPAVAETKPTQTEKKTADHKVRVLVLDDEDFICDLIKCSLKPLGFDVTDTTDPEDAIARYRDALTQGRPFDVVISDLTIPGTMGGQEAVRRLRELDPHIKAIVSSGYAQDPVLSSYREYGFCAILPKPYEPSALGKIVRAVADAPSADDIIQLDFTGDRMTA